MVVALAAARLLAHDFWIAPSAFRTALESLVQIRLMIGHASSPERVKRNEEKIREFFSVSPSGLKAPVVGVDGADPAGYLRVKEKGIYVVAYRSQNASIELEAAKFQAYLEEEGLESVLEKRRERKETDKPARETYSRCAKSLIEVTAEGPRPFDRNLELPLELVPERDPFALRPNEALSIRLLHDGKPLAGALVAAEQLGAGGAVTTTVSGRTAADGKVSLRLPSSGPWMVKCVHMFEAADKARADWESLWATLTFEVPPAPESRPDSRR